MHVLILNFLKFAGGGFIRFAPLVLGLLSTVGKIFGGKEVKKYFPFILIGIIALYYIYTREEKLLLNDIGGDVDRKAVLLSRYLGTTKGLKWWQPTTWHEDETSAFELLMDSTHQIKQLEAAYNAVTDGRFLRMDIERYLTTDQIDRLYGAIN